MTVLCYKMKKSKSWITVDSWKKIENRRVMKRMVDGAKSGRAQSLVLALGAFVRPGLNC